MNNNRYKILLVEDESNIRNLVRTMLEASEYQVIVAKTCSSAITMYTSYLPDLIILDLGLPDKDGLNLLKKVREASITSIIILSAHSGKMMTYSAIIKAIWGYPDEGNVKKLQVNMANIRRKFGVKPGEPSYIINELGVGYRINSEKD